MLALVSLLLAAQAPAEPAGMPRATPAAAAAGAAACRGLPDDYEAAVRRLLETGWERATVSSPAQPDAAPLPIFGRDRVIMVVPPPDHDNPRPGTGCMVTAAFERNVRWAEVVAAANTAFGVAATASNEFNCRMASQRGALSGDAGPAEHAWCPGRHLRGRPRAPWRELDFSRKWIDDRLVNVTTEVITHRMTGEIGAFHTEQGPVCGAKMVNTVQALLEACKAIDGGLA